MTRKCAVPGCTNRKDPWGDSGRRIFNIANLQKGVLDSVLAQLGLGKRYCEGLKRLNACEDHFAPQSIVRRGPRFRLTENPVVVGQYLKDVWFLPDENFNLFVLHF